VTPAETPERSRPAWEFSATGTRWRLYHDGSLTAATAAELAAAVESDEARWSRFRPDSELSELNRTAGDWRPVSEETFALLTACRDWMGRTGDLFTPLVGSTLRAWGYAESLADRSPSRHRSPAPTPVSGRFELDPARCAVWLAPDAELDLGGIGKGWIAGRLAVLAVELGLGHRLLIDAGGDMIAVDGEHVVAVESVVPQTTELIGFVRLRAGEAIATSGFGRRRWINGDGRTCHHLIDPRTGSPGPLVHATVLAGDPVTADVMAKVLALAPERLDRCEAAAMLQTAERVSANERWAAARA
jgi:thiamine biosynthesis lipoprotein